MILIGVTPFLKEAGLFNMILIGVTPFLGVTPFPIFGGGV